MSQYPPSYPQQPYPGQFDYYQPYGGDALAPAKRAGMMMFLLAALIGAMSLCCVGTGTLLPQLMAQHPEIMDKMKLPPDFTPQMLRIGIITVGVVNFVLAMAMLLLGVFVRKGGLGSIVTSIVLVCLVVLGLLFFVLSAIFQMASGSPADIAPSLCMIVIPLALSVLLLVWLVQAARAAPRARAMQQQYQSQMWQYQQQAAAGGWGYGAQAQAPPTASPPSPPPAPPGDSNVPPAQG